MKTEKPFVAVAGSIAVGKSSLVSSLARALEAEALPEEIGTNPFFDRFYEDPFQWSFRSQMAFVADALRRHTVAPMGATVVQDRTVYESIDVFCRLMHRRGNLNDDDLSVFERLREVALGLPRQPTLLIYLHAPTEVIMERIERRNRPAEQRITSSYIDALNTTYASFAERWSLCPMLAINTHESDVRTSEGITPILAAIT